MDDWGWMSIATAVIALAAVILTIVAIVRRGWGKGKKPPPPEKPSE